MQAPLVARREPAGVQKRPQRVLYVFQQKTKNIPIYFNKLRLYDAYVLVN